MKWLPKMLGCGGFVISTLMVGLSVARAAVPLVPTCSWPFESTGQGVLNVATQDTNTTYWFMPLDTRLWSSMKIQGTYPAARAFNFTSYTSNGSLIGTISDNQIAPDSGSTNPFTTATANGPRDYTVSIGSGGDSSGNVLNAGGSSLILIVYRVIVPDQGLDKSGGVGAPTVNLVARTGAVLPLRPCPFAAAESSLGNMIPFLVASGFSDAASFLQSILTTAQQPNPTGGGCVAAPFAGPAALPFGPAPGTNFFPDPLATYAQTGNVCYQSGGIIVVRAKALVYPNTYLGGTVFQPAFDGQVQVRYWSMCNNDSAFPYPVIGCQADFETALDQQDSYTYVVSNDLGPPAWLPPNVTWLPWGPTNIPVTLIFRVFLPSGSTIPANYYPQAVTCDQTLFMAAGASACFTAAGINLAGGS